MVVSYFEIDIGERIKMISRFSKRWTLGLMMLALVIVLWVLSSFMINLIFEDGSYRKPFFITYINTAAFTFYLLPTSKAILKNYWRTGQWNIHDQLRMQEEGSGSGEVGSPLIPKSDSSDDGERLSLYETIKLSAEFCILWFSANFVTNASLSYTSVASQTILSSTSSFFTLFVGALCRVEKISKVKVIGSMVSFFGILLVTRSDSKPTHIKPLPGSRDILDQNNDAFKTLIGNILALLGALLYGVYSTLLKRKVKDESRVNMKVFFGFVGLFTLIFLWPSMILLHYMGWETFELPSTSRVIAIVVANCLITFISDFCWANAMLLTSPLTVTVGLSVTIPFAMFGDFILKHKPMTLLYLLGAILILGSFFIINKSSEEENLENLIEDADRDINDRITA